MPHVTSDSLKLYYEIVGEGPPILFLHGYTATIALWQNQVPVLKPNYTVVCLDQRGHGQSQASAQSSYTLPNLAGDALAVLDALDIQEVIVVGHSMGGMVAFEFLAHHGERIKAAVFSSTTPNAPPREYFKSTVEFARTLDQIPANVRVADPMMQSSKPVDEATALGCGEMIMSIPRYIETLHNTATPCLVIHGRDDSESIRIGSRELIATLINAEHVIIERAGHVPQITHSGEYNAALADFLTRVS